MVAVTFGWLKNFSDSSWFQKRNMNLKVIPFMHVTTHKKKRDKINIQEALNVGTTCTGQKSVMGALNRDVTNFYHLTLL